MYDYLRLMASYNHWVNLQLYGICATIPDAERRKEFPIYFRSLHGTLNHLLYGDRSWMGRFTDNPFTVTVIGQELYTDFDELRREREQTDWEIKNWAEQVRPEWLTSPFSYVSNVDGKKRVLPGGVLAVHFFNHQTHHRGQITTLLDMLGYEHGITDIPWMPEFTVDPH